MPQTEINGKKIIFNDTIQLKSVITLSWKQRIKVLFGAPINVYTHVYLATKTKEVGKIAQFSVGTPKINKVVNVKPKGEQPVTPKQEAAIKQFYKK